MSIFQPESHEPYAPVPTALTPKGSLKYLDFVHKSLTGDPIAVPVLDVRGLLFVDLHLSMDPMLFQAYAFPLKSMSFQIVQQIVTPIPHCFSPSLVSRLLLLVVTIFLTFLVAPPLRHI